MVIKSMHSKMLLEEAASEKFTNVDNTQSNKYPLKECRRTWFSHWTPKLKFSDDWIVLSLYH